MSRNQARSGNSRHRLSRCRNYRKRQRARSTNMAFPWCLEQSRRYDVQQSGQALSAVHRELLIQSVIRRVAPPWWHWPFNHFNICPLNDLGQLFHIDYSHRNSAYLLLDSFHCMPQSRIPREIRRAIPDLVREALSSKITVTCEIEEDDRQRTRLHSESVRSISRTKSGCF